MNRSKFATFGENMISIESLRQILMTSYVRKNVGITFILPRISQNVIAGIPCTNINEILLSLSYQGVVDKFVLHPKAISITSM